MLSGDTATIRLDDGNVVEVPVEYVEIAQEVAQAGGSPPEPEPSPGDEDEDMESTTTPEAPAGPPDAWQPEPIEIPEQKFNFFNRPYNRADLKARQELAKVEATWYHAMRANDQDLAGKMYRVMEECFSFMDPHPDETAEKALPEKNNPVWALVKSFGQKLKKEQSEGWEALDKKNELRFLRDTAFPLGPTTQAVGRMNSTMTSVMTMRSMAT
ncbi:unnamed protein product, partial [Durusdinium trenchii]